MYKKIKGLFFVTACMLHINASAMEVAGQQNTVEQPRPFPTLQQLSTQAAGRSCVKGSRLFKTALDEKKLSDIRNFSMIPEHLVSGIERAAREYQCNHPGLLPVVTNARNADLLPNHDFWTFMNDYDQRFVVLLDGCRSIERLSTQLWLMSLVGGFVLNGRLRNSDFWGSFNSVRSTVDYAAYITRIPTTYLPLALYIASKPTPRKVALGCASAGLLGYGLYKKLK